MYLWLISLALCFGLIEMNCSHRSDDTSDWDDYLAGRTYLACDFERNRTTLELNLPPELNGVKRKSNTEIEFRRFREMSCLASPEIFDGIRVKRFRLEDFKLSSWYCPDYQNGSAVKGFKYVGQLEFAHMQGMDQWNWGDVNDYTGNSVETLVLTQSRDRKPFQLTSDFNQMYGDHVKTMYVSNMRYLQLEDYSLSCVNCVEITVMFSNVANLSKDVFAFGVKELRHLNLYGNEIERLPKDLFQYVQHDNSKLDLISSPGFPKPHHFLLQLGKNPLRQLDRETFEPLRNNYTQIVIVFDNAMNTLKCDCELGWLYNPKFKIDDFKCLNAQNENVLLKDFFKSLDCLKPVLATFSKFLLSLPPINFVFPKRNSTSPTLSTTT